MSQSLVVTSQSGLPLHRSSSFHQVSMVIMMVMMLVMVMMVMMLTSQGGLPLHMSSSFHHDGEILLKLTKILEQSFLPHIFADPDERGRVWRRLQRNCRRLVGPRGRQSQGAQVTITLVIIVNFVIIVTLGIIVTLVIITSQTNCIDICENESWVV